MINSNDIQERQNNEFALKVQYAARMCFNSAEKYNHLTWIACLVSAFSVFFPSGWPMYIINGIPGVADAMALVFGRITSQKVSQASMLRKYFDSYVLDIQVDQFSESELRKIREQTERIYENNLLDGTTQITNTGYDSPPGVRDWYVFQKDYEGIDAQFECQRQNTWWNSNMVKTRIITTALGLTLISSIFLFFLTNNSILNVLLCSVGIIGRVCERLIENWKYFRISRLIEGAQQAIEVHPTAEGVKKLQNLIDERRSINVLEFGYFHKKLANKLSGLYKNISL